MATGGKKMPTLTNTQMPTFTWSILFCNMLFSFTPWRTSLFLSSDLSYLLTTQDSWNGCSIIYFTCLLSVGLVVPHFLLL